MDAETRKELRQRLERGYVSHAAKSLICDLLDRVAALEEFRAQHEAEEKEVAAAFEKATTPAPQYVTLDVLARETDKKAVREWFGNHSKCLEYSLNFDDPWQAGNWTMDDPRDSLTHFRVPLADADAFRAAQKKPDLSGSITGKISNPVFSYPEATAQDCPKCGANAHHNTARDKVCCVRPDCLFEFGDNWCKAPSLGDWNAIRFERKADA